MGRIADVILGILIIIWGIIYGAFLLCFTIAIIICMIPIALVIGVINALKR